VSDPLRGKRSVGPDTGAEVPLRALDPAAELSDRIAAARKLKEPMPHCAPCWERGRDAALRVIERGEPS
jgi:hypothetical protein